METKLIQIHSGTWKKLTNLKAEYELQSFDKVINKVLNDLNDLKLEKELNVANEIAELEHQYTEKENIEAEEYQISTTREEKKTNKKTA